MQPTLERSHVVDAAALHPDLGRGLPANYFRACAAARHELKSLLSSYLQLRHDLYLLSNTSHGLVTVAAGLAHDGIILDASSSPYPGYAALAPLPQTATGRRVRLLTHVDPLSGVVADLASGIQQPIVLDAAQSFGTIGRHADIARAEIFICPLHKHVGIAPGLGLLGLRPDLIVPGLKSYAAAAEQGTAYLPLLRQALDEIERHNGNLVNTLTFNVDKGFRSVLDNMGITLLTPNAELLPFVCLRGPLPGRLVDECLKHNLSTKHFVAQNIIRISGAKRGALHSIPDDRTVDLLAALRSVFTHPISGGS
ncbi:DUF6024 family protein [Nguyenibacter sp. L1]|uniref:DUF6024 family protein n=1 Tax=Nguyenibacter sp. L1 TaxID=3049350 RepID=UPI002B47839E|nr:DUF6024 family protein [Nguyenibacter sp. L1]WRH86404.1 DUF6024 family protein [Nguyenibacter sp. L1]